jgi:hypothetical protein
LTIDSQVRDRARVWPVLFCLHAVGVELEQFEGALLERVLLGELVEAGLGAVQADAVAAEGGERVEQVAEAVRGKAGRGSLRARFGLGGG